MTQLQSKQKNTDQLLQDRFDILPEGLHALITDQSFTNHLEKTIDTLEINPQQKITINNYLILVLTLFIPLEQFIKTITNQTDIPLDIAQLSFNKFIQLLPNEVEAALHNISDILTQETEDTLSDLQEVFPSTTPLANTTNENNTSDTGLPSPQIPPPKETPAPEQNTPPTPPVGMRTMETDMNRIHGYGAYRAQFPEEATEVAHKEEVIRSASQEELLAEKPKLADMPTYEEGEEDVKE